MSTSLSALHSTLKAFTTSPTPFRIISTVPPHFTPAVRSAKTLLILDSSFNPPTIAHLRLCLSALRSPSYASPKRLILLLATNNAEKSPKPAAFEQRLAMMERFAGDILSSFSAGTKDVEEREGIARDGGEKEVVAIDIAVTPSPYFVDKAAAITSSGLYSEDTQNVLLVGFDTLIRILDPKWYDQEKGLGVLNRFFESNSLRVTMRAGDQWGGRDEQRSYLDGIGRSKSANCDDVDGKGARREWVDNRRIELVEGRTGDEEVVSSSRIRGMLKSGDSGWKDLVTANVGDWIGSEGLYIDVCQAKDQ